MTDPMTPQEMRELAARLQRDTESRWPEGMEQHGYLMPHPIHRTNVRNAATALTQAADRIERLEGALVEIWATAKAEGDGSLATFADKALHPQTEVERAPIPQGFSGDGFDIVCRKCGATTTLPYTDGTRSAVLLQPMEGWEITIEEGTLCPKCAPPEPKED